MGIPLLITEASLGRLAAESPLTGFGKTSGNKRWNAIGWLEISASLLILGYYIMIMAWVAIYGWEILSGKLLATPPEAYSSMFTSLTGSFPKVFLTTVLICAFSGWVVTRGLQKGLERASKIMMPLLFLLIIGLGAWSVSIDGAAEGIRWYLDFDFSKITSEALLAAVGQLFFSIGIGFSTAYVFGSYMSREEDLVYSTGMVVLMDTLVAFLAGFMIFPALFAFDIPPDSGPNLVFITMSNLFSVLPFGQLFGSLFFLLLFMAGITSVISNVEAVVYSIGERFLFSRNSSVFLVLVIIVVLSIPNTLSFSETRPFGFFGATFYDWMDFLTNMVLLPLAGLLLLIFGTYILGFERLREATNQGSRLFKMEKYWSVLLKFVIPLIIVTILINGILT